MREKISFALNTGHDIVWIDEAVFSMKKFKPQVFQPRNGGLSYTKQKNLPAYIAAVCAISKHRGLICYALKEKAAFNGTDFAEFMEQVRVRVT